MINKELIKSRFGKNFSTYNDNAFVQKKVVENLTKFVPFKMYGKVLEIGCGTGLLTQKLDYLNAEKLFINDMCEDVKTIVKPQNLEYEFIIGDAEEVDFPKNLGLIISSNALQWLENIEKFFEKSAQALTPSGMLIFSTFTTGNYEEIAKTFGASLEYKTITEIQTIAKQYFDVKTAEEEAMTLYFSTLKELFKHIKHTGVNALSAKGLTKSSLLQAKTEYEKLRTPNGLPLTYKPAYFVMEKR